MVDFREIIVFGSPKLVAETVKTTVKTAEKNTGVTLRASYGGGWNSLLACMHIIVDGDDEKVSQFCSEVLRHSLVTTKDRCPQCSGK